MIKLVRIETFEITLRSKQMKKLLMFLLTCLCLAGCSSSSGILPCELEGSEFELISGDYWVTGSDPDTSVSFKFKLKNKTEETVNNIELYLLVLDEEKEVCDFTLTYETLEPGITTESDSWVFPNIATEEHSVNGNSSYSKTSNRPPHEDEFTAVKLVSIIVNGKEIKLKSPIVIPKEDMSRKEGW